MRGRIGHGPVRGTIRVVVRVLVVVRSLAPVYWGVVIAFSSAADILRVPVSVLPRSFGFGDFANLLGPGSPTAGAFLSALVSSVVQGPGTTVLTLLITLPAAYAFARVRIAGSRVLLAVVTITLAVPVFLVLIPLFQLATSPGQINTQQGVILVLTSAAPALAVRILRIVALPEHIEAAARLDGVGTFRVLRSVVGPLVAPGLVAAAVVMLLASRGAFLVPLVHADIQQTEPLTVLIPTIASRFSSDRGLQVVAGLIAVLPPVVLVVLLQRYLLSGLLKGATK